MVLFVGAVNLCRAASIALTLSLLGCGEAPVMTAAGDVPAAEDRAVAADVSTAEDAGVAPDVVTPDDVRLASPDVVAAVDAGCRYEPVTPDRNGEPRNSAGNIRWCWPGEPRCTCDADNDCYAERDYTPRCAPGLADAGAAPRDVPAAPTDVVTPPRDVPTVTPDVPVTMNGSCSDAVPPTTTGPVLELDTIRFNWSMQCYRPENGSLFVFIEDTENQMVALRFYDFLNNGGPATGSTVNLAQYRLPAAPFFVSTISGIQTEPMWSYQRGYVAYAGQVIFHQLQRTNPVGTRMRVEFRDVWAREVRQYTNGRCDNVANGGRMHIRSIMLDLPVNNLHTDQDCIDWAGG
ncbi:MAG: hypothetical protein R3A48_19490 [Polyangiales bacterium]